MLNHIKYRPRVDFSFLFKNGRTLHLVNFDLTYLNSLWEKQTKLIQMRNLYKILLLDV